MDKTEPTAQPIKEYCKECGQKEGYGHLDHCNKRQIPPPAQVEEWEKEWDYIQDSTAGEGAFCWDTACWDEDKIKTFIKSTLQKAVEEAVTERDKKFQNVLNNFSESGDPWKVVHELESLVNPAE